VPEFSGGLHSGCVKRFLSLPLDLLQDGSSSLNREEMAEKYNLVPGIKAEGKKTFKLVL
jgi:hypothetical protein